MLPSCFPCGHGTTASAFVSTTSGSRCQTSAPDSSNPFVNFRRWWVQNSSSYPPSNVAHPVAWAEQRSQRSCAVRVFTSVSMPLDYHAASQVSTIFRASCALSATSITSPACMIATPSGSCVSRYPLYCSMRRPYHASQRSGSRTSPPTLREVRAGTAHGSFGRSDSLPPHS